MKKLQSYDFKSINLMVGVLATIMIFFTALVLKDSDSSFTGLEIAFGKEFANLGSIASGEIAFNPLVLLAFSLPLIGGIVPLFVKKGYFISTLAFIASAVMIFMIPDLTTVTVTILGNVNEVDVSWTYGIGLIFAGSLSILGALIGLINITKNA